MENQIRTEIIRYFRTANGAKVALETKAYEVYPNIWVIPSRYSMESLQDLTEVSNPEQFGVYDKNYLTTQNEQDEYLKSVQASIEVIKQRTSGWDFLTAISGAVPLPEDTIASNATLQCLVDGMHDHDVVANIVIWGPGNNLNQNRIISRRDKDDSNGLGSMIEILWNPKISIKNVGTNEIEPAVDSLIYLLTKALFRLYGLGLDTINYPFYQLTDKKYYSMLVEDMLAYGGFAGNVVNLQPYYFLGNKFTEINTRYEDAKKKIDQIQVNDQYKELLNLKYQFSLHSLLNIWTSNMYSTIIPSSNKYGGLTSQYVGPNAIVNADTGDSVNGMSKTPTKKVQYAGNPKKEYDEYDFANGQEYSNFFNDFTFPEISEVPNSEQAISENVFAELPAEEISKITLPNISSNNAPLNESIIQITPTPIESEVVTSKEPTLGLAITAVQTDMKLADVKMTDNLKEALDSDDLTFIFDYFLAQELSDLTTVSEQNFFELIKAIKNELLSTVDEYNDATASYYCPEWVNHCFHEIYGDSLSKLMLIPDKFEEIFNINDMLQLPNTLPTNTGQLKPYLFYQWYAKRYTRILRLESLFYQLLCQHVDTIRKLVKQDNSGGYLEGFLNDLSKITYRAQYMLSDWTEYLGYQDYQTQLKKVLTEALDIADVSYDLDRFMLTINEYRANSIKDFGRPQRLRLTFNKSKETLLWLGNDALEYSGNIKISSQSPDDESSFLLAPNTEFYRNYSGKYLLSSLRVKFTFNAEENQNILIALANIRIEYTDESVQIDGANGDRSVYSIKRLSGWNTLVYLINQDSIEIWNLTTDQLLIKHFLGYLQSNEALAEIFLLNSGSSLLLREFEVFEQEEDINNALESHGFNNGIMYSDERLPVVTNQAYELKNMIFGDPGILVENTSTHGPSYSIEDIESNEGLIIRFESSTNEKVYLNRGYNIFISSTTDNYLSVDDNGNLIFVPKGKADVFYCKQASIAESSLMGYVIKTDDNQTINTAIDADENSLFSLNVEPGIIDSTQDSDWLILPQEYSSALFYMKYSNGKASIKAKDSILFMNEGWNKIDNFVSATDIDGNLVQFDDKRIKVEGSVDIKTEAIQKVKYIISDDTWKASSVANILVMTDNSNMEVHDGTIHVGDTWNAKDYYWGGLDVYGNYLNFDDKRIKVEGSVDTTKAGNYSVSYTVEDTIYNGNSSRAWKKTAISEIIVVD